MGVSGKKTIMDKLVNVTISTSKEYLNNLGLSLKDVKCEVEYLSKCFGKKYPRMFPVNIYTQDIDRILYVSKILKKIENCDGFKRHLREYNKNNIKDHLFTAKTAGWLLNLGYKLELEPNLESPTGGKPDILVTKGYDCFVIECKNINFSKFFEEEKKEKIAGIIFDKVQTCDQLTLYIDNEISLQEIGDIFSIKSIVTDIYKSGMKSKESNLSINNNLEINILQKPAIIGREDDFLAITIEMIMEDNKNKVRLPGYVFSKGGRSVGVFGPKPNYSKNWNRIRGKSKKQAISGYPMVVIVNGDSVLGSPKLRNEYFENVWLTKNNSQCSGVGVLHFMTLEGEPKLEYFPNSEAEHTIEFDV